MLHHQIDRLTDFPPVYSPFPPLTCNLDIHHTPKQMKKACDPEKKRKGVRTSTNTFADPGETVGRTEQLLHVHDSIQ